MHIFERDVSGLLTYIVLVKKDCADEFWHETHLHKLFIWWNEKNQSTGLTQWWGRDELSHEAYECMKLWVHIIGLFF